MDGCWAFPRSKLGQIEKPSVPAVATEQHQRPLLVLYMHTYVYAGLTVWKISKCRCKDLGLGQQRPPIGRAAGGSVPKTSTTMECAVWWSRKALQSSHYIPGCPQQSKTPRVASSRPLLLVHLLVSASLLCLAPWPLHYRAVNTFKSYTH